MSINILVNGKQTELPSDYTLYDLIIDRKWRLIPMLVRIDGEAVPSSSYSLTKLREGQDIKVIPQFGGG
jgi:thiamine biosynthesis protein ThiS